METLSQGISNGIVNYLKEEGINIEIFDIDYLNEQIDDINRALKLNVQLKNISGIKEILIKEIEKQNDILEIFLMLEDCESIGIDLDLSIFKNSEITQKLFHNTISYSFLRFRPEGFIYYEYPILLNFSNKYDIDLDISKMSKVFEKEIKLNIAMGYLEDAKLLLTWVKKNNIVIELSDIPDIKDAFEKGIFDEFRNYSTNKIMEFAKNNNIEVDFQKILKSNIVLYTSGGCYDVVNNIMKKADNLGINIQLSDLPGIENAFYKHLLYMFELYSKYNLTTNSQAILKALNFAKENNIALEGFIEIALFEAIKRAISLESGRSLYYYITDINDLMSNTLKIYVELSEIPNIKEAFYNGIQKTKVENRSFLNEYLKQLAIVNNMELDLED